jgi:TonB dependent receptor
MVRLQMLSRASRMTIVMLVLCANAPFAFAQGRVDALAGRRLEDALRELQARGLRLVFSSELVTADMRVVAEPAATDPRSQLDEILAPHKLEAAEGPGGVIQVVRRKQRPREPARGASPAAEPTRPQNRTSTPRDALYLERITVRPGAQGRGDASSGPERHLGSVELSTLGSRVADDPLRVVQALPGVSGTDDFRSEYSVRGSSYRHAAMAVDGVLAPWLQHAARGRGDTGTITMLPGGVVEHATLLVGAYSRQDGSQLGPQLDLTLREGSRTAARLDAGISSTSSIVTAEGPLGAAERGSWLVGLRKSHTEWPVGRSDHLATVFGFSDLQSKIVYDVRPSQQVSLSVVAGLSSVERDDPMPSHLGNGSNRAALVAVTWRSVMGSRTVITQRASAITQRFDNHEQSARLASTGGNGAGGYRVDMTRALLHGVLETGGEVRRLHGSGRGTTSNASDDGFAASWRERAGYASFSRTTARGLTLGSGLRVADSSLVDRLVLDRWMQAEWTVRPTWLLYGSAGVVHQFPSVEQVRGWAGTAWLRPERATSIDVGIRKHLSPTVRWNATLFARAERDVVREPSLHPRLVDGVLVDGSDERFENALEGSARGIEVMIERRSATGISGWIGYSYGVAHYVDRERQETFAGERDQRHAVNVVGSAPIAWKARTTVTFRAGSNVPIPGYLTERDVRLFAGERRNQIRLPAYARLDLRVERPLPSLGHRFTLFVETINVLNRVNMGPADGAIMRETGQAVGFTEQLFPRLLSAGVQFGF